MLFKDFESTDIINNTIVTHPKYDFFIYQGRVYKNDEILNSGSFQNLEKHITQGEVSLHELNVNRPATHLIYPFVTKQGSRTAFKTISTSNFSDSSQFNYGDKITGSYPQQAGVTRILVKEGVDIGLLNFENRDSFVPPSGNKKYIRSLKTILNDNARFSKHYSYSSEYGDKSSQKVNMICVPSIIYGSKIKPGSLKMKFYVSGSLVSEINDSNLNGEMVETTGSNKGSVAGVVLYNHGLVLLTGSWKLHPTHQEKYEGATIGNIAPKWNNYGNGIPMVGDSHEFAAMPSSSYGLELQGVSKIPTLTLFAHSEKGEHTFSNNPTYIKSGSMAEHSLTSTKYMEKPGIIKNIVNSPYPKHEEDYETRTFISSIGIYDENYNLIGVAKLANPLKKKFNRDYTFKLKLDF